MKKILIAMLIALAIVFVGCAASPGSDRTPLATVTANLNKAATDSRSARAQSSSRAMSSLNSAVLGFPESIEAVLVSVEDRSGGEVTGAAINPVKGEVTFTTSAGHTLLVYCEFVVRNYNEDGEVISYHRGYGGIEGVEARASGDTVVYTIFDDGSMSVSLNGVERELTSLEDEAISKDDWEYSTNLNATTRAAWINRANPTGDNPTRNATALLRFWE